MASTVITPNQDALVSEIHVDAPAERIFQALIDPKQVMQWWNSPDCQIESFSLDPRKGGRWTYDTKKTKLNINGTSQFHCDGEVLEYDPPRVLAYTWSQLARAARATHGRALGTRSQQGRNAGACYA
jgi:uncharacterized protein YndB with AHSA1/START domain